MSKRKKPTSEEMAKILEAEQPGAPEVDDHIVQHAIDQIVRMGNLLKRHGYRVNVVIDPLGEGKPE